MAFQMPAFSNQRARAFSKDLIQSNGGILRKISTMAHAQKQPSFQNLAVFVQHYGYCNAIHDASFMRRAGCCRSIGIAFITPISG